MSMTVKRRHGTKVPCSNVPPRGGKLRDRGCRFALPPPLCTAQSKRSSPGGGPVANIRGGVDWMKAAPVLVAFGHGKPYN